MNKVDYKTYWLNKGTYGRIRIERMLIRKNKRKLRNSKKYTCFRCKETFNQPLPRLEDPFSKEMYDISIVDYLCNRCYNNSLGDI